MFFVVEKIERVRSGIPGLDELIEGGFPKNSIILVTGGPGTGKTILTSQFIIKGAEKYKEPGIFISLEEEPERMITNFESSFNWPIRKLIKKKLVTIIRAELYDFAKLKLMIEEQVEKLNAKRLVLDPATVIGMFFERELEIRRALLELNRLLKRLNCTSLLTCEVPEGKGGLSAFGIEEFTSDGIIVLHCFKEGNVFTRALSVRKMRATNHDMGIHPIRITSDGMVVYSTEQVFGKT